MAGRTSGLTRPLPWSWPANIAIPLPAATFAMAFAVLFLRRPGSLLVAEFFADDGAFYGQALGWGARTLVQPYAGYFALVQRAVVLGESAVAPVWAPVVGNAASLVIMALVAAFLASSRMSAVIPERRWRLVLAMVFVLLPASTEQVGSMRDSQWVIAVYLVAILVATPPSSPSGRIGDALGVIVAGLTGPFSIILWPLFAIRAWRAPAWRWHLTWISVAASVQAVEVIASGRGAGAPTDWSLVPQVLAARLLVYPVTGIAGPGWSPWLAALIAAACVLAAWRLPRAWTAGAVVITLAVALLGIRATWTPTQDLLDPTIAQRYFYLGGVLVAGIAVVALSRRELLALPLTALLAVGIVVDARMPDIETTGWAAQASCIGGDVPCVVPIPPVGSPASSWVHWPGP
jgi:hypothetical protein